MRHFKGKILEVEAKIINLNIGLIVYVLCNIAKSIPRICK